MDLRKIDGETLQKNHSFIRDIMSKAGDLNKKTRLRNKTVFDIEN